MSEVRRPADAHEFLQLAGPLLLEDEARNNLILGIAGSLVESPDRYPEKEFWVVVDGDGEPAAAAMRTPPYNLILAWPRDGNALATLAGAIDDELPGVVGSHPEIDLFCDHWCRLHGGGWREIRGQGVYALERVQPVPPARGTSRAADPRDRELLTGWMLAFGEEVLEEGDPGRLESAEIVAQRLEGSGGFLLWEDDGEVVSAAGWGGPTPNGIRVGPVYTPPERRGRGYATALVAELSQQLLDSGRSFVFLYTDLANPTSNAIYMRIGYEQVAESAMVAFER